MFGVGPDVIVQSIAYILLGVLIVLGTWGRSVVQNMKERGYMSRAELQRDRDRDRNIYQLLDKLLTVSNGDRAYIFLFHNGSYWINGQPMKRFSCAYEVVLPGITREAYTMQGLLMNSFPTMIDHVTSERQPICFRTEDILRDTEMRRILESQGVDRVIQHTLVANGNPEKIIGFVGVDFVKISCDKCGGEGIDDPSKCVNRAVISECASQLAFYLTKSKKENFITGDRSSRKS